jgi:aspartyl-tRNA(Asn)/glutamyl-tRNA(Gln) amidotransferase subunit A
MPELHDLTAAEAARRIRAGSLTATALVEACLRRIDAIEPAVGAWVHLDREGALATARARDAEAAAGRWMGALHGVPVALKDIFDAAGYVTTAGAPPFAHRRPTVDAASVTRLRAAGAVVMGKVTTTAFALMDPTATRNPWHREHTPGGSSAGSAAAVGGRMVPLALGSQTVGSTLRPAVFCGAVGFKATHGRISAAGVVPLCWSTDHVGMFSRSVEDAALALGVLAGHDAADPLSLAQPVEAYASDLAAADPSVPPRIGVLRELVDRAEPEYSKHLRSVVDRLAAAGATIVSQRLPASFAPIHDQGQVVVRSEAAAFHAEMFARHAAEYPPKLREALEEGRRFTAMQYLAARDALRRFRADMAPLAASVDAMLSPVAPGAAPHGLGSTGDAWFCAPWSFSGMPSIAFPSGLAGNGLPIGVQLTSGVLAERRLLQAAAWCERVLAFAESPRA